jgi:hypothetical protein
MNQIRGRFRQGFVAASIGGCRSFRPLAENQRRCFLGLLQHYRPIPEIGVRQCRNSEALDGFKIRDATVVRVVGVLLFSRV